MKKSLFKRWWFWVIVIFIIIGAISNSGGGNNTDNGATATASNQTASTTVPIAPPVKDNSIKAGMYKVGSDIQAGEYVLVENGSMAYFQITKDSTGTLDSILANDNFSNRSIITIKDGQYLEFRGCKAYLFNVAPTINANNVLPEGMYKVGTDLSPGEYKITADGDGYIEVSKDSTHNMLSIVSNDNFSGEKYVTVSSGQYLKMNNASLVLNK